MHAGLFGGKRAEAEGVKKEKKSIKDEAEKRDRKGHMNERNHIANWRNGMGLTNIKKRQGEPASDCLDMKEAVKIEEQEQINKDKERKATNERHKK